MGSSVAVTLVETSEVDVGRLTEISKRAFDADVDVAAQKDRPTGYDSEEFYGKSLNFLDCYNILLGEELVGGVMAKVGGRHGVLDRVFVDPDHQRKGVGSVAMGLVTERYPEVADGPSEHQRRVPGPSSSSRSLGSGRLAGVTATPLLECVGMRDEPETVMCSLQ